MFLKACTDSKYLSTILFSKRFIEIISMVVPIALILTVAITLFKIVTDDDMKNYKSHLKSIYGRTIAAVLVFFTPTIVNVLTLALGTNVVTSSECWKNANPTTIKVYQEAEKQQEEAEAAKLKAEKEKADEERKVLEATREAARAKNEDQSEEAKQRALAASEEASWAGTGTASATAAELIRVALSKVGIKGRPNEITRGYGAIGGSYDYHWCAAFVWYVSSLSGVYPEKVPHKTAGVQSYMSYFKGKGQYQISAGHGGTYVPKMGDYIFFDWEGNAYDGDHIGIVKTVEGGEVLTIEGNSNDSVAERHYSLTNRNVIGYGVWE